MIEVEIRAELSQEQFAKLLSFMRANGTHTKSQNREMILLRGYPGYSEDPTKRETDVRIKNTNGHCEFVVKRKASTGNHGRTEFVLRVGDAPQQDADGKATFAKLKEVVRALGYSHGLWMHRITEAFQYKDIEWALIRGLRGDGFEIVFYEAEKEVAGGADIPSARATLLAEAKALNLPVLETDELMRNFIYKLDREVNREISL